MRPGCSPAAPQNISRHSGGTSKAKAQLICCSKDTTLQPALTLEALRVWKAVPEEEDVEDGQVERQTQRELSYHQPGEDLVCDSV